MKNLIMKNSISLIFTAALTSGTLLAADQNLVLSPRTAGDLGSSQLLQRATKATLPSINRSREAVSFNQVLGADQAPLARPAPHIAKSQQFWLDMSASELAAGVQIPLTSRSAILRLSPTSTRKAVGIGPQQLSLEQNGRTLAFDEAFDAMADAAALKSAGMSAGEQTIAVRLGAGIEAGPVILRASGLKPGASYVVHVFEPMSKQVMSLQASAAAIISGQSIDIEVAMQGLSGQLRPSEISGYVVSPDGTTTVALKFEKNGSLKAQIDTAALSSAAPGLWEAHAFVQHQGSKQRIMRDAKVSFALSPATARLSGNISLPERKSSDSSLTLKVGVEVGLAGRYQVSALIYGGDKDGNQKAGVLSTTAAWLDSSGNITLDIPSQKLADAGISAPFSLKNLVLKDQTRMADLWRQAEAVELLLSIQDSAR